ncbi:MAG: AAA family ATPase, partial [Pseudohongiella sp.]|nr:AAA family ATPase [Pseudohongiella sp.]
FLRSFLVYLEYYSLERPPFRITPDPSLFFTGGANGRGVVLEALLYAIQTGEGILKVVGEVGSGKTMLCRMLEQRLPDSVEVVYLANPKLTPHDILYAVAFELKIDVTQDTPRLVLMQKLQSHLLEQHAANRSVLVIIEEAQSMPLETLEEIRLFSNLETHQHKLMQIVLFGQPELDKNLQEKNIRQLKERITHSFYLKPLTPDEVSDYLRHRLQAAGCPAPQIFSKAAENLIAKASGGLTRRINILADKAMLAAYSESATATRPRSLGNQLEPTVTVQHVKAAIQDSDYKQHVSKRMIALGVFVAVIVAAVIAIMAWMLIQQNSANSAVSVSYAEALTAQSELAAAPVSEASAVRIEDTALVEETPFVEETNVAEETAVVEETIISEETAVVEELIVVEATNLMADATQIEQAAPLVEAPRVELTAPAKEVTLIATAAPATQSAPSSPVAANTTGRNIPPILAERLGAFDAWTNSNNLEGYTLRILSVSQDESAYLTDVLQQLDREHLLPETYACQLSSVNGQFWQLYFGTYDSVSAARAGIRRLPTRIRNNQPFAQNVARIGCLTERG